LGNGGTRLDLVRTDAGPDPERAIEQYRRLAPIYDVMARVGMRYRRKAVELLELGRGEIVVDVACGTGLNFEPIIERVGPEGRLFGIDLSPDMLARARARAVAGGWDNVELIKASVERAVVPDAADAALLSLTHDVMRSPAALEKVMDSLRPSGRIAVLGVKWAPRWALPINLVVRVVSTRFVTTLEGYDRPWSHLQSLMPNLQVKPVLLGAAYLAWGNKRPDAVAR
jgi:demethylmenaquinone methyltransferase/2-methoxy-6-polyprenyl-1,4-benzoquinol methylase